MELHHIVGYVRKWHVVTHKAAKKILQAVHLWHPLSNRAKPIQL